MFAFSLDATSVDAVKMLAQMNRIMHLQQRSIEFQVILDFLIFFIKNQVCHYRQQLWKNEATLKYNQMSKDLKRKKKQRIKHNKQDPPLSQEKKKRKTKCLLFKILIHHTNICMILYILTPPTPTPTPTPTEKKQIRSKKTIFKLKYVELIFTEIIIWNRRILATQSWPRSVVSEIGFHGKEKLTDSSDEADGSPETGHAVIRKTFTIQFHDVKLHQNRRQNKSCLRCQFRSRYWNASSEPEPFSEGHFAASVKDATDLPTTAKLRSFCKQNYCCKKYFFLFSIKSYLFI